MPVPTNSGLLQNLLTELGAQKQAALRKQADEIFARLRGAAETF